MIVDGKVYDISKYMDKRPAGIDAIMSSCGNDATAAFDQCHQPKAKDALKEFYLGELAKQEVFYNQNRQRYLAL